MKFFDGPFPTPAANLAADEALLDACDRTGAEALRLWESAFPFVVVGYANKIAAEVNVPECEARGVPILRRCSGGGTVVQGPGCLNYAVVLRIPEAGPLTTVTGTNHFVMEKNRAALEQLLGSPVAVRGHTDLALQSGARWLKFSGNAQRRRHHALLFHGTVLCHADLPLIDALLHFPSKQPDYRADRAHGQFITNFPCPADAVKRALRAAWQADEPLANVPAEAIAQLATSRYATDEWNRRA